MRLSLFLLGFVAMMAMLVMPSPTPGNTTHALDIDLKRISNTEVEATIVNFGTTNLKLLKRGTFLDDIPLMKCGVAAESGRDTRFIGIKPFVAEAGFGKDDFETLEAGRAVTIKFDIAETWDVSSGGIFHVIMAGKIPAIEGSANVLNTAVQYQSNSLELDIDAYEAQKSLQHFRDNNLKERKKNTCEKDQRTAAELAHSTCHRIGTAAVRAAMSGPPELLIKYFTSADNNTRFYVASVLQQAAFQCAQETDSVTNWSCSKEHHKYCDRSTVLYTFPDEGQIIYCPIFPTFWILKPIWCVGDTIFPVTGEEAQGRVGRNPKYHDAVEVTRGALTLGAMTSMTDLGSTENFGYNNLVNLNYAESLYAWDAYLQFAAEVASPDC